MSLDKYCAQVDRVIVDAIINQLLADGAEISVYDGEEITLRGSTNYDEIADALATTGYDVLMGMFNGDQNVSVRISLMYNDDGTVVQDYVSNEYTDNLIEPILSEFCQ